MYCMNCGWLLPSGAKYCRECGTPAGKVSLSVNAPDKVSFHSSDSGTKTSTGSFGESNNYNSNTKKNSVSNSKNYRSRSIDKEVNKEKLEYFNPRDLGVKFLGPSKNEDSYVPKGCRLGPDGFLIFC